MSNERSTVTFTTAGGHTIVMYDYITGREASELSALAKLPAVEGEEGPEQKAQRRAFEIAVRSIDTRTENVADDILDLPLAEYQEVVEKVTNLLQPAKK